MLILFDMVAWCHSDFRTESAGYLKTGEVVVYHATISSPIIIEI
jgi:hypothetical protein